MKTTIGLLAGLPRKELVEKIYFHHRQGEVAERALGFYLLDMQRSGAFRPGHRSAVDWARRHLELGGADKLILLAQRLEKLPRLAAAFDRGEVAWTKIREVSRVATEETEEEWLDVARRATSRELEDAVARARKGDRPDDGVKIRRKKYRQTLMLTGEEKAIWES